MDDAVAVIIALCLVLLIFRWLGGSSPGQGSRGSGASSLSTRIGHGGAAQRRPFTPEMVATVQSMFPDVRVEAIRADLSRTGSVAKTCDNILTNGSLPMPPPPLDNSGAPIPAAGASSSSSASVTHNNLVQRYNLQAKTDFVPVAPEKAWAASPAQRQEVLRKRKEFMILQARQRFLEKEKATLASSSRQPGPGSSARQGGKSSAGTDLPSASRDPAPTT